MFATLDAYEGLTEQDSEPPGDEGSATIFVVHGHADGPRLKIENLIRRATAVEPIVLADRVSGGSVTLIEKLEEHLGQPLPQPLLWF